MGYVYKAGVVGGGLMGAGIAQVISYSGLPVVLKEVDPARIILLGHGEGGFFAATTVAYQKNDKLKIAGIILVATPGRTYVKILRDLAQRRLIESGAAEEKVNAYLADFDRLLTAISSGNADFTSLKLDASDPLFAQIRQNPSYFFHLAVTDPSR